MTPSRARSTRSTGRDRPGAAHPSGDEDPRRPDRPPSAPFAYASARLVRSALDHGRRRRPPAHGGGGSERDGRSRPLPVHAGTASRALFTWCRPNPPRGGALFWVRSDISDSDEVITLFCLDDVVDSGFSVVPCSGKIVFALFNVYGMTSQVYVMRGDCSGVHVFDGFRPRGTGAGSVARRLTYDAPPATVSLLGCTT